MSLFDLLQAQAPARVATPEPQEVGDLERIIKLPRRPRPAVAELQALIEKWGARLGTGKNPLCQCARLKPHAPHCCDRLFETQAWALEEMSVHGGLVGPIGVGHGKTLLDLLAAMAVPDVRTAVLFIPPNLKKQLLEVDWSYYSQHWRLPNLVGGRWLTKGRPDLHVVAYSELSGAKSTDLLGGKLKGVDLIIADEVHSLSDTKSARTKRFRRFMDAHAGTKFVCWSGTLTKRELRDFAHLSNYALKSGSPTPHSYPVIELWSKQLDPTKNISGAPGPLARLVYEGEHVLTAFQRRQLETPGVVSSPDRGSCEASLAIDQRHLALPANVASTLEQARKSAERPDGELIVENALLLDCLKQIACGFYYRWRWVRGESDEVIRKWLAVRKEYHKELRERLEHSSAHMDSPLLLFLAAERWHRGYTHIERDEQGREVSRRQVAPHTKSGPQKVWASEVWPEWVAVRDTAAPETEAVWLSDFMVQDACRWLEDERGVAWYHYDTLGRAVAKASGAVYAGPGQEGDSKLLGLDGSKPLVASIKAHGTGKNLQMYSKALVLNSPAAGDVWEQLLGRLHRHGQQADEVSYWVYQHTEEVRDALDKACARAEYIQGMHGGAQKLSDAANWRF